MDHTLWSRKEFLTALSLWACGCACRRPSPSALFAPDAISSHGKPNLLFIISDDLCTALGGYRPPQCKTPNLDRLASRGVLFDRAYSQFPLCGPSRASLMCGQYPAALGTTNNGRSKFRKRHPDVLTLPQLFRQHGYYAARVSKIYHMGIPGDILRGGPGADDPLSWDETVNIIAPEQNAPGDREDLSPKVTHQGVDFIKVEAEGDDLVHADGKTAQHAIRLLRRLKDRPFLLAVGMVRPHVPLAAPKAYFKLHPFQKVRLANVPNNDLEDVPKAAQSQSNAVKYGMDEEQQRKTLGAYYATVSYMDAQVGRILDELDRLGLAETTAVVFTSDHGYNLGEHTCWQKLSLWEDSVRVPLIISAPWMAKSKVAGRRAQTIAEHVDLFPTLAELCGLEPPAHLPGTSLCPVLHDPEVLHWPEKAAYTITTQGGESLRTDRWRYSLWKEGQAGAELYDHKNDPGEFNNLANDPRYQDVAQDMEQSLKQARERASLLRAP